LFLLLVSLKNFLDTTKFGGLPPPRRYGPEECYSRSALDFVEAS